MENLGTGPFFTKKFCQGVKVFQINLICVCLIPGLYLSIGHSFRIHHIGLIRCWVFSIWFVAIFESNQLRNILLPNIQCLVYWFYILQFKYFTLDLTPSNPCVHLWLFREVITTIWKWQPGLKIASEETARQRAILIWRFWLAIIGVEMEAVFTIRMQGKFLYCSFEGHNLNLDIVIFVVGTKVLFLKSTMPNVLVYFSFLYFFPKDVLFSPPNSPPIHRQ